ncbi:MAG: ABC transporter substrate-binding protein [Azonexus sp.]|jgi:ABC-type sugar transport system substrate-binding protein|nr:ABC transporter substrate-binding protein [Azonexus sp.]
MNRLAALLAALFLLLPNLAWAMSVAFINPGKSDETYWLTVTRAMEAAAKDLGIHLEVLYAERQHPRVFEFAREIIARPVAQRPDYVVFTNDYATGPELLRLFDGAGIKTFMALSGISEAADRLATGAPRERYRGWLGSLEPRAEEAGYLTAKALIERGRLAGIQGKDGRMHLLAISGDRSTPSSILRSEGMRRAVNEAGDVVLDQEVYGAWNREKAAEQSEWLFQRHPQARLVWAGNDLMAFGAMQVWEKRGGKPGKDAWFSGINTSAEAMQAIKAGRLEALSGGHFIAGAWALVMLYDYEHGRDFAALEGLELNQSMFALFSPKAADRFMARYGELRFESVNFRRFSKVLNPKLKRYDFSFRQLLD